ncbi:hypothetical protein VRB50_00680 [Pseudomonas poae]|uniref:cytidine deaminase-like fold-containing protein n=1 Tax=Pseudomonas TaxID=286 RepID=UPI001146BAE6|nr:MULTISPECIES: hypothetical protein [Pseudomonas]MCF5776509.1 hypothetical protein [Pseudomonas poae]
MFTDSETAALAERNVIEGAAKGAAPKVAAEGKVGGQTFQDVNQTSRPLNEVDPKIPSLITDRIADKAAKNPGKLYPNGNMKDAHAEIGVIQQAYSSGKLPGRTCPLRSQEKMYAVSAEVTLLLPQKKLS